MKSCLQSWSFGFEMLKASSTDNHWVPKTRIFPVANAAEVMASVTTAGRTGNIQVNLGLYLWAVRLDKAGTLSTLGSAITTNTNTAISVTLSAGTSLFGQLGYVTSLTTGSAEGTIMVAMDLAMHQCVELIGARSAEVPPTLDGSASSDDALIVPIGPFVPAVGSPKLKGGLVLRNNRTADLREMMIYRTATDRGTPNDWQFGLEAGWTTTSAGNSERNTGELTPTVTNAHWLQPGWAFRRIVSGSQVRADFDSTVLNIR